MDKKDTKNQLICQLIKSFLKASRNLLVQLEHPEAKLILDRISQLEATLCTINAPKRFNKLKLVRSQADQIALEILDLLDKVKDTHVLYPYPVEGRLQA